MVLLSLLLLCSLDMRGIWIPRWSIDDQPRILSTLDGRFNHIFLQVFALGEAYYPSRIVPSRRNDDTWLRDLIQEAHARNIKVSAWVNVFYSWGFAPRTRDQRHPINLHPNWYVENESGQSILDFGTETLKRWGIEGYYLAPASGQVHAYLHRIIDELLHNYDFDGIHLDYCRYPGHGFIYDVALRSKFMRAYSVDPLNLSGLDLENRYGSWGGSDLQKRWQDFVREDLTGFIKDLRVQIDSRKKPVILSVAVKPDHRSAARDFYQNWPYWVNSGLVDLVCLMAYSNNIETILSETLQAVNDPRAVAVGLGIYRLGPDRIRTQVRQVAARPFRGVVFFSYEELKDNTAFLDALD